MLTSAEVEECGQLPDIPKGDALKEVDSFPVGTKIKYKCKPGYYFASIGRFAICELDEENKPSWNTHGMECRPITCGVPQSIENGWIEGSRYTFPNSVKYICNIGYELKGINVRYCGTDGEWTGNPPNCKIITCPKPEDIENGSVNYVSTEFGSVANYNCKNGFHIEGDDSLKCNAERKWSGIFPKCIEIVCPEAQNPDNGKATIINGKQENIVIYDCDPGYNLIGRSIAKCIYPGKWDSDTPICAKHCTIPNLGRGKIGTFEQGRWNKYFVQTKPKTNVEHGKKLFLLCDKNYEIPSEKWYPNEVEIICDFGVFTPIPACHPARCRKAPPSDGKGIPMENYENKHNSIVTYINACSKFEKILRNKTAKCNFGEWTVIEAKCQDTRCNSNKLKHINGLNVINSAFYESGEIFNVHCNKNYDKINNEIHCKNGEWEITSLPCKPANCNDPPPLIKNGEITKFSNLHGSKVTYHCFPPYKIKNESIVICSFGKWIGNVPLCENDQCNVKQLEEYEGVKTENKMFHSGYWYQIKCEDGYSNNEHYIFCKDGKWQISQSSNKLCKPGNCLIPYIANGEIKKLHIFKKWYHLEETRELIHIKTGSSVAHGSEYFAFCDHPYKFQGLTETGNDGKSIKCYKQQWIPKPECLLDPITTLPNAIISKNINSDKIGITTSPKVFQENTLSSNNTILINSFNISSLNNCTYHTKDRYLIAFLNGNIRIEKGHFAHGTRLKFSCESPGIFRLRGPVGVICKNGTWESHFPSCHRPYKGDDVLISVQSSKLSASFPDNSMIIEKNSRVIIRCYTVSRNSYPSLTSDAPSQNQAKIGVFHDGTAYSFIEIFNFKNEDLGNYTCKSKSENEHFLLFKILSDFCRNPGVVEFADINGDVYKVDSEIHYKCFEGYKLVGSSTLRCLITGEWSSQKPKCEEIQCPLPQSPENGEVIYNSTIYNSEIIYKCKYNYQLIGDSNATCKNDGQWSSHVPICGGICKHPGIVEYASVYGDKYEVNDEIYYECKTGYKLIGNSTLRCLITGEWTSQKPECKEIRCPVPHNPENGEVEYYSLTYNSEIFYKCNNGYELVGEEKVKCTNNSQWSSVPTCKELKTCNVYDLIDTLPEDVAIGSNVTEFVIDDTNITLVCASQNHVLLGQKYTTCLDGLWKIGKSECVPGCYPVYKPENSTLIIDNIKENYRVGEIIAFSCPETEILNIDLEILFCLPTGWSDNKIPDCIPAI